MLSDDEIFDHVAVLASWCRKKCCTEKWILKWKVISKIQLFTLQNLRISIFNKNILDSHCIKLNFRDYFLSQNSLFLQQFYLRWNKAFLLFVHKFPFYYQLMLVHYDCHICYLLLYKELIQQKYHKMLI